MSILNGKETESCPFANLSKKKAPTKMDREKMKKVRWVRLRIRGAEPMTREARVSFFLFC